MRYGPWPRSGRLLRHFSFSSSFPRVPNPGGARPCQGGTHCVQWGGRWRPALTWPRRDYIALPEEEEKRRSNRQPRAAARGRPQRHLPRRQGGRSGEGARACDRCPRGTQPGSKRPFDLPWERSDRRGVGGHVAPARSASPRPHLVRHGRASTVPGTSHACDRGLPAPRLAWPASPACAGGQTAVAVLLVRAARPGLDAEARRQYIPNACKEGEKTAEDQR